MSCSQRVPRPRYAHDRNLRAKLQCFFYDSQRFFRTYDRVSDPGPIFIFVKTTPAKLALYVASWTYRQMDAPIFKVRIASQTGMLFYQMRKFVFIIAF
jgi:hypothetical protein